MRVQFIRRENPPRRQRLLNWFEHLLVLGVALTNFYLVPITGKFWDFTGLIFVVVLGGLIVLVSNQLIRQAKAGSNPSVRLKSLLFLLYPIITVFALAYYVLQQHDSAQFDGITTRTDALYYTIVTLGTVGFGDIHPAGQLAKIITMGQIVFDLVVIGLLLSIAAARMMNWAEVTVDTDGDTDGGGDGQIVDAPKPDALPPAEG